MLGYECAKELLERVQGAADRALCPKCREPITSWKYHRAYSQLVQANTGTTAKAPEKTQVGVAPEIEGKAVALVKPMAEIELDDFAAVPINEPEGRGDSGLAIMPLMLIAGGIMYGVCKDSEEGNCPSVAEAGKVMMIVAGTIYGMCCCCAAAVLGCAYAIDRN